MIKICNRCKKEKPATKEYFHASSESKDGLYSLCKECKKLAIKQWKESNPDKVAGQKDRNQKLHGERYKEMARKRYYENRDRYAENAKKWKKNNPEKAKEIRKRARKKREANGCYKEKYKMKSKMKNQIRRHRKRDSIHTLTLAQWRETLMYFGNSCAYCGSREKLTQEHFVPLSKNGDYAKNNIIPACDNCNLSKSNIDFDVWYIEQPFYSEDRASRIISFLGI